MAIHKQNVFPKLDHALIGTLSIYVKITMARSKVISVIPQHCIPRPPNQCPYQVSTSYTLITDQVSTSKYQLPTP